MRNNKPGDAVKQRSLFVVFTAAISLFAVATSATELVSSAPATAQFPQHAIPTHEKQLKHSGDAGARKSLAHIDVVEAKREEWERDAILALTCDEVGGVGSLDDVGKPIIHGIQAGEMIYQTFHLEVTNSGGHSSVPRPDNAVTQLADALSRIGKFQFPFALSTTTRAYFERRAALEPFAVAADMRAFPQTPLDEAALTRRGT